jgi:hypothetical protein
MSSRFPAAFRPPAFAFGSSSARWGIEPSSRSADHTPRASGPQRDCHVPHTQDTTGMDAPYTPATAVFPQPEYPLPAAACRLATAGCYHPAGPSHPQGSALRGIIRGSLVFARPVFPSPVVPGMERGPFGLNPELRTPPLPATHLRTGTGHRTLARSYTPDMTSTSKLCIHLLCATSCRTGSRGCRVVGPEAEPDWEQDLEYRLAVAYQDTGCARIGAGCPSDGIRVDPCGHRVPPVTACDIESASFINDRGHQRMGFHKTR